MTELPNAPTGYVRVRGPLRREEALVVQSFMEANGIESVLVMGNDMSAYTRQPATVLTLWVEEGRAEEAEALLSEESVADSGDTGTE